MQYPPSPNLSKLVKHYLVFDIPTNGQKRYRYFPNVHNSLVFALKAKEFVAMNSKTELPENFIFRQHLAYQDFMIHGAASIIVVVFQPYGLFGLTGIPERDNGNNFEDACSLFGKDIMLLKEQLKSNPGTHMTIDFLNVFFTRKLQLANFNTSPFLMHIISVVHKERGNISINQLCSQLGVTERKVQRLFSQQIGMSPKKFLQSIKLHFFIGLLKNTCGLSSLTALSLQAGYYDQAHLIREFRKIVGIAPSNYLKVPRLAVNLIEI